MSMPGDNFHIEIMRRSRKRDWPSTAKLSLLYYLQYPERKNTKVHVRLEERYPNMIGKEDNKRVHHGESAIHYRKGIFSGLQNYKA